MLRFFVVFQRENDIGEGLSLVYAHAIVDTIRRLYPEDIKIIFQRVERYGSAI